MPCHAMPWWTEPNDLDDEEGVHSGLENHREAVATEYSKSWLDKSRQSTMTAEQGYSRS